MRTVSARRRIPPTPDFHRHGFRGQRFRASVVAHLFSKENTGEYRRLRDMPELNRLPPNAFPSGEGGPHSGGRGKPLSRICVPQVPAAERMPSFRCVTGLSPSPIRFPDCPVFDTTSPKVYPGIGRVEGGAGIEPTISPCARGVLPYKHLPPMPPPYRRRIVISEPSQRIQINTCR